MTESSRKEDILAVSYYRSKPVDFRNLPKTGSRVLLQILPGDPENAGLADFLLVVPAALKGLFEKFSRAGYPWLFR